MEYHQIWWTTILSSKIIVLITKSQQFSSAYNEEVDIKLHCYNMPFNYRFAFQLFDCVFVSSKELQPISKKLQLRQPKLLQQ